MKLQARTGGLRDAQSRLEEDSNAFREQRERLAGQERALRRARQELDDDKTALAKREHRIEAREAEASRTAVCQISNFISYCEQALACRQRSSRQGCHMIDAMGIHSFELISNLAFVCRDIHGAWHGLLVASSRSARHE